MNEEANTKLVQQAYQSVNTGDIPSFLNVLTEDVLWILPDMANVPFAGTWQGREQVGEFFRRMSEVQDVVEFKPEEFIAKREKAVVLGISQCASRRTASFPAPSGCTCGK